MTMTEKTTKPLILIAEDDKMLLEASEMILKAEGYRVQTVTDGQQALDFLEKTKPDLILLDLRMPVIDGIEFLKKANITERFPKLPVIVFSNYDVQKDIDESYNYGATRYILKAWASPKELAKVVKETIGD
jgi:CheY-like chemotaxis protein